MESGLRKRGALSVVLRFVASSVTCFIYLLSLAPCLLKSIIATVMCREPAVRITFIIKNQRAIGWARYCWHHFTGKKVG